MDPVNHAEHLSRISTIWSEVRGAHSGSADKAAAAQAALVERYQGAVYGYLLGAVRDPDVAAELFQEFALRLVRGDFGRADPGRGRFRDYVKTTLINLVIDQRRRNARGPVTGGPTPEMVPAPADTFDPDRD